MLRLRELAQRDQGVAVELTEASWWPELLRKVDVGEVWVVGRGGARGEECWRSASSLLMPRRGPCGPCEGVPGFSEALESTAAKNSSDAPSYLRRRYGENPARAGLRVAIGALESSLVPRRNSFGAWSELGCGGVTVARCSAPSRGRAELLGFWRGCCGWEQGGPRGGLKRAPGSRRARSRRKPARFSGGDRGWPLRGRERRGRRA